MNFRRIVAYIFLMCLATGFVGFVFAFFKRIAKHLESNVPFWLLTCEVVTNLSVVALVYARLAVVQPDRLWVHAWSVGVGTWLLGYPINVLWAGEPPVRWRRELILIAIVLPLGVGLGRAWCRLKITMRPLGPAT